MRISPDDPILTAYALGEIEDDDLANEIEQAVAESAGLRETVEAIRATSAALEGALAAETIGERSENITPFFLEKSSEPNTGANGFRKFVSWPWITAAAAAAVFGFAAIAGFISIIDWERRGHLAQDSSPEESAKTPVMMAGRTESDAETTPVREQPVARRFGEFSDPVPLPTADAAGSLGDTVRPDLRGRAASARSGEGRPDSGVDAIPPSRLSPQYDAPAGEERLPAYRIDPQTVERRSLFSMDEFRREYTESSIQPLLDELRAKFDDRFAMPGSKAPDTEQRLLMNLATEVLELRSEVRKLKEELARLNEPAGEYRPD